MMRKYFPVMAATFIWIWPAIIIKVLNSHFDNFAQNFYRFFAASVILIILNLVFYKEQFLGEFRNIRKFILPAMVIFLFQTIWVWGLFILTPTIAVLINRTNVLFIAFFSFLLFKDERRVIKSKAFLWGSLLAIIGVVGVITGKGDLNINDFNMGAVITLTGAVLWAGYIIVVKKKIRKTEPLVAAGIIYTLSVPLFFLSSLFFGDLGRIFNAPRGINLLLLASGIFCVGVANAFNFKSIKFMGTAVSSAFVLITPFFTGVASYFIFKEALTIQQILSGIILIAGCAISLRASSDFIPSAAGPA